MTGFLVRSTATQWAKGSILAVDAGAHLSAITSILKDHFPMYAAAPPASVASPLDGDSSESRSASPEEVFTVLDVGPFAGLPFPHASARANSLHVLREYVSTYLITHPHLDHFAAFAINTAGLIHGRKAKHLAGLEFTVKAIKDHIFNDIIWPNMTNEEKGIGFVNLLPLAAGGNVALGEGESRGFIEVCDGLAVKGFKISHGTCGHATIPEADTRRGSAAGMQDSAWHIPATPGSKESLPGRRSSLYSIVSQPATPTLTPQSPKLTTPDGRIVVDSTAFFIRAEPSGREILVFGDVEPDSISHAPRTHLVWQEAAPKFIQGDLRAVFIECSYPDAQVDGMLFGHLVPRHLVQELQNFAEIVSERRRESIGNGNSVSERKRKRQSMGISGPHTTSPSLDSASLTSSPVGGGGSGKQRRTSNRPSNLHDVSESSAIPIHLASSAASDTPARPLTLDSHPPPFPLTGLTVIVIHVKDDMRDGPWVGDIITAELQSHEARLVSQGRGLGCEFRVSRSGESYFF